MELADLSSEELRRRALTATVEVVSGWALKRPQLIVIEDSHWADTLTEALLTQLAEGIAHLPVFLVVTSRQEPRSDFRGHPHIHLLALPRLDLAEIPTLLESIWQPVPKGLARFVHKKSEGVPLFAEELARLLRERFGTGVSTERDWERSLKESGVATLQDLLSARLAALGRVRYVAQVASAIGRGFSVDVLSHLIEMGGSSPSLDEAVAALVAQGIIRPRKLGEGPIFSFRHVLMHEVAYASLLKAERHRLHNRIVDLVGSGDVAPPSDDLMAWHCEQAGRSSQAAGYAIRAAEACAARWALDEANKLLATAEEQLRLAAAVSDADDLMLRLLTVRGSVAMALFGKGSTEARSVYEQGVRLCRQKGVGERERWLPLYWGWWFTAPDHFVGTKRAEVILDQLDKVGDPEVRLQALHCGWAANFHAGRHEQSLQCIEHGLTLYDPDRAVASRARYGGHDAKVCGLGERALLEWLLDRPEAARQSMAAAIGCAESIEHLGSLCHALDIALTLYGWEHDHATVAQLADRLGRIADLHDLPNAAAKSKIFSGWARAFDGDLSGGLVKLNHGLDLQKAIGTDEDMPIYAGMAAELLARLGREAAASQLLDEALEQAERAGNLFWVPELYRRRASLRRNGGEDLKSPDLDRALELARKQGAKALVRRITSDHAGMGLSSGRAH
jgi:predicted ATPase